MGNSLTACDCVCVAFSGNGNGINAKSAEENKVKRNIVKRYLEDYEISEEKLLFLDSGKAYEYASERLLPLEEIPEFNGY